MLMGALVFSSMTRKMYEKLTKMQWECNGHTVVLLSSFDTPFSSVSLLTLC